ncbi:uncharacterized protein LOC124911475 [Impatiens glandulifera]|uniref:uncharacterized protein LOC124911475 n=1 Tax=Impatiens glandulifera TaxID=253017 RepID=UPI001FB10C94|nr:uncharacterized protein LOC124911475 [Impatiens glandulifera]
MAATSRRTASGPVLRSLSPANTNRMPSAFATSTFSSPSSYFFNRSASPTRVNLYGTTTTGAPSVRFTFDRPISPSRSISASSRNDHVVRKPNRNQPSSPATASTKRTCMCSPTNHPGSFRCSLHKNHSSSVQPFQSNRLNARRSAMTNSLVRIGTVEGDLVKRALAALIRPSSHHQRRRVNFQPRPSRLSIMSKAEDS